MAGGRLPEDVNLVSPADNTCARCRRHIGPDEPYVLDRHEDRPVLVFIYCAPCVKQANLSARTTRSSIEKETTQ